jgi:hypothetical protein
LLRLGYIFKVFFNIYRNYLPRYMSLMPVLFVIGLLFSAMVLVRLRKKNPRPDLLELFVFLWLAGTFVEVVILNYQPLRYYLPIAPGLFLALSLVLKNLAWLREHKKEILWVFLLLAAFFYRFWIGLVISFVLWALLSKKSIRFKAASLTLVVIFSLSVLIMIWLSERSRTIFR